MHSSTDRKLWLHKDLKEKWFENVSAMTPNVRSNANNACEEGHAQVAVMLVVQEGDHVGQQNVICCEGARVPESCVNFLGL